MSSENDNRPARLASLLGLTSPPSKPSASLSGLMHLNFGRPEVKGLYYNGQTLTLDGYSFVNCRFDNCVLDITSTNFDLIQCVIDPSTTIKYGSTVLKIIQLFNSRYDWAYQHFPGFVPVRNENGTITISERVA